MKKLASLVTLALAVSSLGAGCAAETAQDDTSVDEGALAQIGAEPTGRPSKHAIVLAHGFDASDTNRWSFKNLEAALERDGHVVHTDPCPRVSVGGEARAGARGARRRRDGGVQAKPGRASRTISAGSVELSVAG